MQKKKKTFFRCRPPKTEFTFIIYTKKNIYIYKFEKIPFLMPIYLKNSFLHPYIFFDPHAMLINANEFTLTNNAFQIKLCHCIRTLTLLQDG